MSVIKHPENGHEYTLLQKIWREILLFMLLNGPLILWPGLGILYFNHIRNEDHDPFAVLLMFDGLMFAALEVGFIISLLVVRPLFGFLVACKARRRDIAITLIFKPVLLHLDVWSKLPRILWGALFILCYLLAYVFSFLIMIILFLLVGFWNG